MTILTPPSQLPQWALQDQIDPVSLQNNVLPPPDAMTQYGFYRQQFPPRQWFNWLFRTINNWIVLKSQLNHCLGGNCWLFRTINNWIAYLSQQADQQVV